MKSIKDYLFIVMGFNYCFLILYLLEPNKIIFMLVVLVNVITFLRLYLYVEKIDSNVRQVILNIFKRGK